MMKDLIERYVRAVGQYLSDKDRADVQNELRSQIQDTLDDRFGGTPSQDDVVKVLTDLGDPARLALAYGSKQYLVGPELYPTLMRVLGYGLVIVPAAAVALSMFGAFTGDQSASAARLSIRAITSAIDAALTFFGVTLLIFFILQRSGYESRAKAKAFNPLELLSEGDPRRISRSDLAINIASEIFGAMLMGYFLMQGGLPLTPFTEAGVIPVPNVFLIGLALISFALVALQLFVLIRSRWSLRTRIVETVLELAGVVLLHFAVIQPLFTYAIANAPASSDAVNSPIVKNGALLMSVIIAAIIVIVQGAAVRKVARG
jgi:hypothetical protein